MTRRTISKLPKVAWFATLFAIWTATLSGCTDGGPRRYPLRGSVQLDGKPVNNATIIFTPKGRGLAAAGEIINGKFTLAADVGPTQGEFNVRINPLEAEMQEVEGEPAAFVRSNRQARIAKIYQRDGKLFTTVTGEPDQTVEFELSSTGK